MSIVATFCIVDKNMTEPAKISDHLQILLVATHAIQSHMIEIDSTFSETTLLSLRSIYRLTVKQKVCILTSE